MDDLKQNSVVDSQNNNDNSSNSSTQNLKDENVNKLIDLLAKQNAKNSDSPTNPDYWFTRLYKYGWLPVGAVILGGFILYDKQYRDKILQPITDIPTLWKFCSALGFTYVSARLINSIDKDQNTLFVANDRYGQLDYISLAVMVYNSKDQLKDNATFQKVYGYSFLFILGGLFVKKITDRNNRIWNQMLQNRRN